MRIPSNYIHSIIVYIVVKVQHHNSLYWKCLDLLPSRVAFSPTLLLFSCRLILVLSHQTRYKHFNYIYNSVRKIHVVTYIVLQVKLRFMIQ